MKIMIIRGYNPYYKDDTEVYCEGLERLGHTINRVNVHEHNKELVLTKQLDDSDIEEIDLIWCPYERETIVGTYISENFNKPLVGHFEWVPPWRVGIENPKDWGYENTNYKEDINKIAFFKDIYKAFLKHYIKSTTKTIVDEYCLNTIQSISDTPILNYKIKPYIVDDKLLLSQKSKDIEEKNQIMSTARLVPHKRIQHIIQALSMVKNIPSYRVIGGGPELGDLTLLANKLGVDFKVVGNGQDGQKARLIQESMFSVNIWAGLPIAESALFSKPALSYEHICSRTASGDMATYSEWNNVKELSDNIQYFIDNPSEVKRLGKRSYNILMESKASIFTTEEACKRMEKILKGTL